METFNPDALINLISTTGFPIVCVLLCFWFIYDTNQKHREDINNLHTQHNNETKKLSEAINNNTEVMNKLVYMLENKGHTNE